MVKEPIKTEPIKTAEEQDEDLITLLDDDGNEVDFYHAATVEYKNEWYIFLQPAEEMEDIEEDELVIFKLERDENGDDLFTPIEDEELLDAVYHEYEKLVDETLGEEECGCGEHHEEHKHGAACGCEEHGHEHKHEGGCCETAEHKHEGCCVPKQEAAEAEETKCRCGNKAKP